MKRMRIVGLALVAAFAMSALASTAMASPVFYSKANIGSVVPGVAISGTLGAAYLEGTNKSKITCTGGSATGEVTSATVSKNNVTTFTGCETSGLKCHSAGAAEGIIVTEKLEADLGAITSALPGERLFSESEGRGGTLAAFECGGIANVVVTGSVIGSLTGAAGTEAANGKFASSNKLEFAETAGKQKYSKFEGEATGEQLTTHLNGGEEPGGQSVIATLKSVPASNLGFTK